MYFYSLLQDNKVYFLETEMTSASPRAINMGFLYKYCCTQNYTEFIPALTTVTGVRFQVRTLDLWNQMNMVDVDRKAVLSRIVLHEFQWSSK